MEIYFIATIAVISMAFMVWSCVEVGSNDAANLVNAVFGARIMRRAPAVLLAGIFVILGASFASPVMDTVRKGIFDISLLNAEMAVSVFISAYLVGTLLLYVYSNYGLPVSTTATLVFCLAGGAIGAYGGVDAVNWPKLGKVVFAIVASIAVSGTAAFVVQRIFRKFIGSEGKAEPIFKHGPWITGLMMTALFWFMIVKGMKAIPFIKAFKAEYLTGYGTFILLAALWAVFTLITTLILKKYKTTAALSLFRVTAVLGMACMAFAFGQNDLANAASPGIASLLIWQNGLADGSKVVIPMWGLAACGFLIFLGMRTKRAQRVTRAEVNTASQFDHVVLYAPRWCIQIGKWIVKKEDPAVHTLAPKPTVNTRGKKVHYDPLRASVILSVGACVIAFASGMGLPVSTTYVAFAAVVATGWGDRVFRTGDSPTKIGRSIWVVTGWFMGAGIGMFACAVSSAIVYNFKFVGLGALILLCLAARIYFKRLSDRHENKFHKQNSQTADASDSEDHEAYILERSSSRAA